MDKILELAREAGALKSEGHLGIPLLWRFTPEELHKFYTLARADLEAELIEQSRIVGMGAERELKLMAENAKLREALRWIANVNAMDYEYQRKARTALGETK